MCIVVIRIVTYHITITVTTTTTTTTTKPLHIPAV
jgi:hypothetical protein